MVANPITRDDIESKLRELKGEVDEQAGAAKSVGLAVGVAAAVGVVALVFLYGKKRGRRKHTVVEIRRV